MVLQGILTEYFLAYQNGISRTGNSNEKKATLVFINIFLHNLQGMNSFKTEDQ